MFFTPVRVDFLNLEGDFVVSSYMLRVESDSLPYPRFLGSFDTFYAIARLLENPTKLRKFLEGQEGMEEVVTELMTFGVDIDGVFYEAEKFED